MKKFLSMILIAIMVSSMNLAYYANSSSIENKIVLHIGKTESIVYGVNKPLDVAPYIDKKSNRTLVALRFIAENLGYECYYNKKNEIVTLIKATYKQEMGRNLMEGVFLQKSKACVVSYWDNYNADASTPETRIDYYTNYIGMLPKNDPSLKTVNFKAVNLDQTPVIVSGRIMVPLRFVVEATGKNVGWNDKIKEITIQ